MSSFIIKIALMLIGVRVGQKFWNWLIDYNSTYTIDHYGITVLIVICIWIVVILLNAKTKGD
jgi:hypothetical protein